MERPGDGRRGPSNGRAARRARQQEISELVASSQIGSQQQLAERLAERGFDVTQATVSRDIAELGLVKVVRGDRHVYASPAELTAPPDPDDGLLRRVVRDFPIQVRRSGLILLLISTPGSAQVISEAIDRSGFEQAGTIAGENTVLVLFEDERALDRWRARFSSLQGGQS